MRISDISFENRPRERMAKFGSGALSDAELLGIILQQGTRGENVIELANRILLIDDPDGLSLRELQAVKGIGPVKAMKVKAVHELSRRIRLKRQALGRIMGARDVFSYSEPKIGRLDKEHFMVIHLDSKNNIIKDEIVFVGTLNASIIHPREIFKSAIRQSANSIVLVHNHPSGNTSPSQEDIEITRKLEAAGEILGIRVVDHVIVGDGYWSYRQDLRR